MTAEETGTTEVNENETTSKKDANERSRGHWIRRKDGQREYRYREKKRKEKRHTRRPSRL